MKILNKNYKIDSNQNKKIVLISDIHYKDKKDIKRLNYILDNIKNISPDYICISGDITDRSKINDESDFICWLKKLSSIAKVIISLGNHELYINKRKKIFGKNRSFLKKISNIDHLYFLDNNNIIIDNINFIGITVPVNYYGDLNYFNRWIKKTKTFKEKYNVLLCHSPLNICDYNSLKDKNIDLILCGHMHGGAIPNFFRPMFKGNGLISPDKKLFPKMVYGHIKINDTDMLITSGIRVLPFKLLNKLFRPEVVTIDLTFK